MADKPTFEEIEEESDPEGDTETRLVQKMGRVDVPDEYLEHLGVSEGEKVFVVCEEDCVKIIEADASRLM